MQSLIYIALLMICDRVRGGGLHINHPIYNIYRKICQFAYGAILGLMVADNPYLIAGCSIGWWLGEKPSWRKLYNELSGIERRDIYLWPRFTIRGLVWALPCLPLGYFDTDILYLALMAVAFPLSAYIGYNVQKAIDRHEATELLRPLILGALIAVAVQRQTT